MNNGQIKSKCYSDGDSNVIKKTVKRPQIVRI